MRPGAAELARLYLDEKQSLAQIGRIYGRSKQEVSRWMRAYGIQTRSISEGTKLSGSGGVHSEEHREKLRQNAIIARSKITAESREKHRQKMLGREPPNKGKPMSEEQRQKLITQRADPEYRRRQGERITGANAPWWRGGTKSTLARQLDRADWRQLRREVYERDRWLCQDCGSKCLNSQDAKYRNPHRKIQAHHVIPRRYGGEDGLENLVTLCMSCHHRRERLWRLPR